MSSGGGGGGGGGGEAVELRIGYALRRKKVASLLQPALRESLRRRGFQLVAIDPSRPLEEQGPFDVILHKAGTSEWCAELWEFERAHPDVAVATQLEHGPSGARYGIPKQLAVGEGECPPDAMAAAGLRFPVVAKPLVADGSARSHMMSLVYNDRGLLQLKPPVVLQEFINHGAVIFKVYVVGDYVKCVRRRSLPDVGKEDLNECDGVKPFSQISNASSTGKTGEHIDASLASTPLPPSKLVVDIAAALRQELDLRLFNYDLIRDSHLGDHYYVIDINYFPGFAKMPGYEVALADFFSTFSKKKRHQPDRLVGSADQESCEPNGS
eukprot:SM000172S03094  [mRNA]  locus=s172:280264:282544:- [translate_table: standard]